MTNQATAEAHGFVVDEIAPWQDGTRQFRLGNSDMNIACALPPVAFKSESEAWDNAIIVLQQRGLI